MASFYSGTNGKMYFGGGSNPTGGGCEAKVASWSFTVAQAMLDTTTLCQTDATVLPGIRTTSGSCKVYYYGENSAASQLMNNIIKSQGSVSTAVTFKLDVGGRAITIPAYIENVSMSCAVGEVVSVDVQFKADGAAISNTL